MSGAANSRIDVTFPTGTTFAGYVSATVRNLTTATNVGSCGDPSGLVIQCSLFSSNTIGAGHNVAITFNGITNPPFQGTDNRARVSTTSDPQTVDSAQFGVLAGQSLNAVTVEPGSTTRVGDHAVRRALRHLELGRPFGRCQQPDRDHVPQGRRSAATRTGRSTT